MPSLLIQRAEPGRTRKVGSRSRHEPKVGGTARGRPGRTGGEREASRVEVLEADDEEFRPLSPSSRRPRCDLLGVEGRAAWVGVGSEELGGHLVRLNHRRVGGGRPELAPPPDHLLAILLWPPGSTRRAFSCKSTRSSRHAALFALVLAAAPGSERQLGSAGQQLVRSDRPSLSLPLPAMLARG
jgi:hypothetical protein